MDERISKSFLSKAPFKDYHFEESYYAKTIEKVLELGHDDFVKNVINPKIFNYMGMEDLVTLLFSEWKQSNSKLSSLCMNCANIESYDGCQECDEGEVDCEYCDGEAYVDCDECGCQGLQDCDECWGDGTVSETVNCEDCNEDGMVTVYEDCIHCNGDGEIELEGDETVECEDCDGEGKFESVEECTTCNGDGNILEEVTCEECDGDGHVSCEYCDAEGRVECQECDWDGNVSCGVCEGAWEGWECGNHTPKSYSTMKVITNPKYKKAGIRFKKFSTAKKATDYILNSDFISTALWVNAYTVGDANHIFSDETDGNYMLNYQFNTITNRPKETTKMLRDNWDKDGIQGNYLYQFIYLSYILRTYGAEDFLSNFPVKNTVYSQEVLRTISLTNIGIGWYDTDSFTRHSEEVQPAVWVIETNIKWQSGLASLMNWNALPF